MKQQYTNANKRPSTSTPTAVNVPATLPVESKNELSSFDLLTSSTPAPAVDSDDEDDAASSVEDGEFVTYCVFTISVGFPFTVFTENTVVALCDPELDEDTDDEVVRGADDTEEIGKDDEDEGQLEDEDDDENQLEDEDDDEDQLEDQDDDEDQLEDEDDVGAIQLDEDDEDDEDEDEVCVEENEVVVGVLEEDVEEDVFDDELEVV